MLKRFRKAKEVSSPQLTITKFLQRNAYFLVLLAILVASLLVRAINLNYNSPFNDEAIYIVVGRLGIFQGDWWTYNAAAWMAGQPYMYPPMTAIAYVTHGIVGSRFLNVIFGVILVEVTFVVTFLLAQGTRAKRLTAGLIAAAIAGASPVALYVSRLATYDMMSFLLFAISMAALLLAQRKHANWGKHYAVSAIFLVAAFFTKVIIGAYIPFILALTYYQARKLGKTNVRFWKIYFCAPILLLMTIYSIGNAESLLAYAHTQIGRDHSSYATILGTIWDNSRTIWPLWAVGAATMLLARQWRLLATLAFGSALILAIHLATHRWPTLDKHVLLSVLFALPVIGIGFANIIFSFRKKAWQTLTFACLAAAMPFYWAVSYHEARRYNDLWTNSNAMTAYIAANSTTQTKVLAEVGAAAILASYDKDFPPNTTTFDWFEYKNKTGTDAYKAALKDGYFNMIELDGGDADSESVHNNMHQLILSNLGSSYQVGYKSKDFTVYRRVF